MGKQAVESMNFKFTASNFWDFIKLFGMQNERAIRLGAPRKRLSGI